MMMGGFPEQYLSMNLVGEITHFSARRATVTNKIKCKSNLLKGPLSDLDTTWFKVVLRNNAVSQRIGARPPNGRVGMVWATSNYERKSW